MRRSTDHKHGSGDYGQEEIILSLPGLPQQQIYLNHIAIHEHIIKMIADL